MFDSQLALAGLLSIPLTLGILLLVFGSVVGASIPLLLGLTSVFATMGLVALPSQLVPMDENIAAVILLIGLAVGVDYSLFYIRRERDERRADRARSAALKEPPAAAAGPGGAHLRHHRDDRDGGDVLRRRQDVHVVRDRDDDGRRSRDARLPDRAAGDAVLARRPHRRGARPASSGGSSARTANRGSGARSSTASFVTRSSPPYSATAVLVALALPALNLHTAISGLDGLEVAEGDAGVQPRRRGVPGRSDSRGRRDRRRCLDPELQAAVNELRTRAVESGESCGRSRSTPLRAAGRSASRSRSSGKGTDDVSNDALATLREEILPATLGTVSGIEYAVTGDTAASKDWNEAMRSAVPIVFPVRPGLRVPPAAGFVPLPRHPREGDPDEPALGRRRLRRRRGDVPVGLGREPARLRLEQRRRGLAADVPVRDPLRSLDGLPRVHPEPRPRVLRPRPRHRARGGEGSSRRRASSRAPRSSWCSSSASSR